MFLLDSDHLSLLQREDAVNETLQARLSAHEETDFWVSIISFHEQVLGAISNSMTLLTRNSVDFGRIPNLAFEDWTTT